MKSLLAVGGAHIDRRGQVAGEYKPGASNPGRLSEDVGGVVFNALRTARKRGVDATLISLRGGDAAGERVAQAIEAAGVRDRSAIFLDRATASYTALLTADGELIAGLADMGLYDLFTKQLRRAACREAIAAADAVLCDANLSEAALNLLADIATSAGKPIYGIAISPAKALRMRPILGRLECLFMNQKEAASLTGLMTDPVGQVQALRDIGLGCGVITAGARQVSVFLSEGIWSITPPTPRRIADVTGAGDALTGATVAALMAGRNFPEAVQEGVAAAMLTLETEHSVADLDPAAFAEALKMTPQPERLALEGLPA